MTISMFQEKVDRAHVEVAYRGKAGHLSGVGDRATDEFVAGAVRDIVARWR